MSGLAILAAIHGMVHGTSQRDAGYNARGMQVTMPEGCRLQCQSDAGYSARVMQVTMPLGSIIKVECVHFTNIVVENQCHVLTVRDLVVNHQMYCIQDTHTRAHIRTHARSHLNGP